MVKISVLELERDDPLIPGIGKQMKDGGDIGVVLDRQMHGPTVCARQVDIAQSLPTKIDVGCYLLQ